MGVVSPKQGFLSTKDLHGGCRALGQRGQRACLLDKASCDCLADESGQVRGDGGHFLLQVCIQLNTQDKWRLKSFLEKKKCALHLYTYYTHTSLRYFAKDTMRSVKMCMFSMSCSEVSMPMEARAAFRIALASASSPTIASSPSSLSSLRVDLSCNQIIPRHCVKTVMSAWSHTTSQHDINKVCSSRVHLRVSHTINK